MPVQLVLQLQQQRQLQGRENKVIQRSRKLPVCVGRGGGATHVVLGALIDGLNIALHLQDLGHSRTSVKTTGDYRNGLRVRSRRRLVLTFLVSSSAGSGVGVFTEGGTMGDFTASC